MQEVGCTSGAGLRRRIEDCPTDQVQAAVWEHSGGSPEIWPTSDCPNVRKDVSTKDNPGQSIRVLAEGFDGAESTIRNLVKDLGMKFGTYRQHHPEEADGGT